MPATTFDSPTTVQGHLPVKADHLPAGYKPISDLDAKAQAAADSVLLHPSTEAHRSLKERTLTRDLTPSTVYEALWPAYQNTTDRVRDLTNEISEQNASVSALRDVKQMIRSIQASMDKSVDIDLQNAPQLKEALQRCKERYGLMVPEKERLNKDDVTALMNNIDDCCNNHSDMGDQMRLQFKKLSSDADATLRLLVEMMSLLQELRKHIISNIRTH